MKVKVVRNIPEERRLKEQELLEEECKAIAQNTMAETAEFLKELNRYQLVSCPVCGTMMKIDTIELSEKKEEKISEKHNPVRSVYVYAKTVECSECKSVISLDERKEFQWGYDFWDALKTLGFIVFIAGLIGLLTICTVESYPAEFETPQEKVFPVTVTNVEQDVQGFQYELTDKEGMTIVVFSEIDQRYEIGETIDVHTQYKADGTKVFSENGNGNSWTYVMNTK